MPTKCKAQQVREAIREAMREDGLDARIYGYQFGANASDRALEYLARLLK